MLRGIPASTSSSASLFLALARNQTYFVNFQYFTPLTIAECRLLLFRKRGQAVKPALLSFIDAVLYWLPEQKARQLSTNLSPKPTLRSVRPSFANRHLMNAIVSAACAVAVVKG
jgi:hypothetical protein